MAEPFLSEMRIMAFGFPPRGWAQCDGAMLQINQNQALFALLGTMYGGDGRTTFGLPDLRGRTLLHRGARQGGSSYSQGQKGGEASQILSAAEIPQHTHPVRASNNPVDRNTPDGRLLGNNTGLPYASPGNPASMREGTISTVGGAGHQNMQPFQVLNFCIALQGVFPSRN